MFFAHGGAFRAGWWPNPVTVSPTVNVIKTVVGERNANEITPEQKNHPNYKIIQTILYNTGIPFEKLHTTTRTTRKLQTRMGLCLWWRGTKVSRSFLEDGPSLLGPKDSEFVDPNFNVLRIITNTY